jgi:hypothetical protein
MISQRFAVEFDRRTVGIAVRVPGGFAFYGSDSRFDELDGHVFPRARAIEAQLKRVAERGARKSALAEPITRQCEVEPQH